MVVAVVVVSAVDCGSGSNGDVSNGLWQWQ